MLFLQENPARERGFVLEYKEKARLIPLLQYEDAKKLYHEMREKAAKMPEDFTDFFEYFLKDAADYAKTRTEWSFLDREVRIEKDLARTSKHDGYMSMLSAVCRTLGVEGLDELLPDRKTKGDFACYIALFLALEQR